MDSGVIDLCIAFLFGAVTGGSIAWLCLAYREECARAEEVERKAEALIAYREIVAAAKAIPPWVTRP